MGELGGGAGGVWCIGLDSFLGFFFTLFLAPHPSITYSCFPFSSPLLSLHSSSCPSIHLYTCRNNLPASRWRCLDGQQLSISRHAESHCCELRTRMRNGSKMLRLFGEPYGPTTTPTAPDVQPMASLSSFDDRCRIARFLSLSSGLVLS